MVVQRFGLRASTAGDWVPPLVGELRSRMHAERRGQKKKKTV